MKPPRSATSALVALMAPPLATGLLGLWLQHRHGVASSRLALMLGAMGVGAVVTLTLAARGRALLTRFAPRLVVGALALLAVTGFDRGQLGVHRWITLGPLRVHASSIACPVLLAASVSLVARGRWAWGVGAIAVAQALHAWQPDAGQSTALALGSLAGLASWPAPTRARVAGVVALAGSVAGAWARPDPLPAVPEVEGIVGIAWAQGGLVGLLAALLLTLIPTSLAVVAGSRGSDAAARATCAAMAAYVAGAMLAPLLGNYPVPVMGFGASPVLGVALCVGFVAAFREDEAHAT